MEYVKHVSNYLNKTETCLVKKSLYIVYFYKKGNNTMKLYDDKNFIGQVIKKARKKAKLNQAELAERVGMSDKNLGNIENGSQFPMIYNFFRLLEELDLSVEDFGVKINSEKQKKRQKLLKMIYNASELELDVYIDILNSISRIKN